jgi:DNA-binding NtrC family response regulator
VKTASILLVDDDSAFRQVMANELNRLGYTVTTATTGEEAVARVATEEPEVVLLDLRLPGMSGVDTLTAIHTSAPTTEVIVLTGHGSIDTAIESIRIGAFDYVQKPCPLDELDIRIQRAVEHRELRQRTNILERGLTPPDLGSSFIGESPEFRHLLDLIQRIAPSDSTVLIAGETGSGKERVAKLIHARSQRHARPFVIVECAALQESLLQSELFGHERGAFTGADRTRSSPTARYGNDGPS